ncbi:hypothetical protein K0M31_014994 [Melipona bicolor]|uniref:Uncharacterized protein n=1 Tax=Melipona bicolor TaxID=60889 RepID=A0AA40FGN5_9HYME|nr:hypothetical protein K0M31_014994 [Melipona bicolor]
MLTIRTTNLDLGALDLGVEPVVRRKGDRQEASGNDTGYGREGQRHRGTGHLGILYYFFFFLLFFFFSIFRLFSYSKSDSTPIGITFTSHGTTASYDTEKQVLVVVLETLQHPWKSESRNRSRKAGLKTNWLVPLELRSLSIRSNGNECLNDTKRKKKRTGYSAIDDDNVLQGARYSAIHITTILSYNNDTNGSTRAWRKAESPSQGERIGLSGGDGCSLKQVCYLCFTFSGAQRVLRFFPTQGIDPSLPSGGITTQPDADGFSGNGVFYCQAGSNDPTRESTNFCRLRCCTTERGSPSEFSLEISMPAFSL